MKPRYLFLSILWLLTFFSCNSSNKKESEQENLYGDIYGPNGRDKIAYHIDDDGWNIILRTEEEEEIFYSLEKTEKDTTKYLILLRSKFDNKARVNAYGRVFKVNGVTHEIVMKLDTFYYFKENSNSEKAFFIGEYNYRFENAILSSRELDYYFLHKDSLGAIRGSNLPKLPSLSPQEMLELQKLVGK